MARKGQNLQERLLVEDAKFAPSINCELCGQPTRSVSLKCQRCLEALYMVEELAYTRTFLQEHRGTLIELGHDKGRRVHLVLMRAPTKNLGWCGARITQVRPKRTRTPQGMFPPGICAQCFEIYEGMAL